MADTDDRHGALLIAGTFELGPRYFEKMALRGGNLPDLVWTDHVLSCSGFTNFVRRTKCNSITANVIKMLKVQQGFYLL